MQGNYRDNARFKKELIQFQKRFNRWYRNYNDAKEILFFQEEIKLEQSTFNRRII